DEMANSSRMPDANLPTDSSVRLACRPLEVLSWLELRGGHGVPASGPADTNANGIVVRPQLALSGGKMRLYDGIACSLSAAHVYRPRPVCASPTTSRASASAWVASRRHGGNMLTAGGRDLEPDAQDDGTCGLRDGVCGRQACWHDRLLGRQGLA